MADEVTAAPFVEEEAAGADMGGGRNEERKKGSRGRCPGGRGGMGYRRQQVGGHRRGGRESRVGRKKDSGQLSFKQLGYTTGLRVRGYMAVLQTSCCKT